MTRALLLLLILVFVYTGESVKPASSYFKICHKTDPNIATCIKESLGDAAPKLLKGVPELGLVPLDPLFVSRLEIRDGVENLNFQILLTELKIYGMGKFKIDDVKVDLVNNSMELQMFSPSIDLVGKYAMDVKVLNLHLKGSGQCKLSFTNVQTTAHFQHELYKKEDKDYVRVIKLRWEIFPKNASFYFTNLFNGDKRLGEVANRFVNDNWREAFKIYKHLPEEAFAQILKDISNKFYANYPAEELYPE